jgi:hypothetical protein
VAGDRAPSHRAEPLAHPRGTLEREVGRGARTEREADERGARQAERGQQVGEILEVVEVAGGVGRVAVAVRVVADDAMARGEALERAVPHGRSSRPACRRTTGRPDPASS